MRTNRSLSGPLINDGDGLNIPQIFQLHPMYSQAPLAYSSVRTFDNVTHVAGHGIWCVMRRTRRYVEILYGCRVDLCRNEGKVLTILVMIDLILTR